MKLLFVFLSVFAVSGHARIPGDKGNIIKEMNIWTGLYGGDAVVCRNKAKVITQAWLLDYAETTWNDKVKKPVVYQPMSDYDFMTVMSTKLERVAPDVFVSFRRESVKLAIEFEKFSKPKLKKHKDVEFVKNLVEVRDARIPLRTTMKNCMIEQLAIREKLFNGVSYQINHELFKALAPVHRRGLALHEAIYHSFNMFYGDTDSLRTRYFHRSLMQHELHALTDDLILNYLRLSFVTF